MQLIYFTIFIHHFCIFLLFVFILLILYGSRNSFYWKIRGVKYVRPWPVFGNFFETLTLRKHFGFVLWDLYNSTKLPFIGVFVGDIPSLLIKDQDLIRNILVKDFNHFYDRGTGRNVKDDPLGSSLLVLVEGSEWKDMRKKSMPIYSISKLRLMHELMLECGNEMIEDLNSYEKPEFVLETKKFFTIYASSVITSTAFGIKTNAFRDKNDQFGQAANTLFNFNNAWRGFSTMCYFVYPPLVKLLKLKFVDPSSSKFMSHTFLNILNDRKKSLNFQNDFIDLLIKQYKFNTDEGFLSKWGSDAIVAQAAQFFVAAFETTGSLISYTLYEFAKNLSIQENVRKEILAKNRQFSYDSLKNMTYLQNCIKETLRMYPILPFLNRMCMEEYKIPGTEITLEKGTRILISLLGLHYDEQYFPKPEIYDPNRYLSNSQIPEGYLAFGDGPRGCNGNRFGMLSAKSALAHVIANYKVELCEEESGRKLRFCNTGFLLRPLDGINLKLTKI